MTLIQVEKRLAAVEKRLGRLQQSLDYSRAVEGIRRAWNQPIAAKVFLSTRRFASCGKSQALPPDDNKFWR